MTDSGLPDDAGTATILAVDDHPVFVGGLERLLRERGSYTVASVGTAEAALEYLAHATANLALIDISLPGRSGLWLAKAIAEKQPGVPCLMLSGYPITLYVREAMASGARGYILKDDVPGILEGIHQVLAGGTFISQALRGR